MAGAKKQQLTDTEAGKLLLRLTEAVTEGELLQGLTETGDQRLQGLTEAEELQLSMAVAEGLQLLVLPEAGTE